jgi:transposase-like protein
LCPNDGYNVIEVVAVLAILLHRLSVVPEAGVIVVKETDIPSVSANTQGRAEGVRTGPEGGRLSKHLCLHCGDELSLSCNPQQGVNVASSARNPKAEWRCSTCGSTFSSEQLRGTKRSPAVPNNANS